MGYNPHEHACETVNDLILNECVKMTEMFICEKILTTSVNFFYSKTRGLHF
jgi:hypothetical protein